ncbi:hypothetical protein [Paenibacillus sp. PL91]|uniref:hypothetical protein n=1 Tax=Paenibacillus sp. PL91 TaxID=2729538 RepID=UPI00145C5CB1|nr:hypothetical protein [Paenibacillus sp. PL91]MBC9205109.1 hypothetical protein [Paenibacillus sp. PL91]
MINRGIRAQKVRLFLMRGNFSFKTNIESEIFCLFIAQQMVKEYNITEDEAINRISDFWIGRDKTNEDDIIFHEPAEFWAGTIYFEDEFWWEKDIKSLIPRKYSQKSVEDN